MPHGNLIIRCDIHGMTVTESESTHSVKIMDLFKKKIKTDTIIVGRDGNKYHVHELFVCMYSDVFTRMLGNGMFTEGTKKEIKIDDDNKIIEEFIKFVYNGERPIFATIDEALALLDAAE